MQFSSLPTFLILISLLISFSIPCACAQASVSDKFIQCLDNQPADAGRPNSRAAVAPGNTNFTTILMSHVRNLRFATPTTPKPVAIVAAATETHVRAAITCCKILDLEMRIRSGGHDYEGFSYVSPVPFVILDMFNLRRIDINMTDATAWVQAGATLGELYYSIAQKSDVLAFPAGICPKVGAGGHFSGGGFGSLMRRYGLSIDHIIDAQIIDANGKVYRSRREMGEDVFWAIRGGGGGNFGVILAWKIELVPVPAKVTYFKVDRTIAEGAVDLTWKWQYFAPNTDRDLFTRLEIKPVKPLQSRVRTIKVSFIGMYLGSKKNLLKITNRGYPELQLQDSDCKEMKWIETTLYWANYPTQAPLTILLKRVSNNEFYWKRTSDFVKTPISKYGLAKIFKTMIDLSPFPRRVWMQWDAFGGIMNDIPVTATPFGHRAGNVYLIQHFMNWYRPGDKLAGKFLNILRTFEEAVSPFVSQNPREAFYNYRDVDIGISPNSSYEEARVYGIKYFKRNFDRLVKVKTMFDPDNFFRSQQGIPVLPR